MIKKINNRFLIGLLLFCLVILSLSIRGKLGSPNALELNTNTWKDNGPFELSPERGRFSLLYSIVEDKSFQFSDEIGKFSTPDVAVNKGRYVSLFAPLLSFITIPGYLLGKYFGISQVGAFAIVSIFSLINVALVRSISIRLGAARIPATIASLSFLFATPAFAYSVSLYQHHISTFFVLLSLYVLLKSNNIWSPLVVFFLCAASIPLDYPNLFFMFPIGFFALLRFFEIKKEEGVFLFKINLIKVSTLLIMIIPIIFFLWFNKVSYDNPFQLSGTLPTSENIKNSPDFSSNSSATTIKKQKSEKSAIGFFKTRNLLNGFYIHFFSPDRGVLYFTPVILVGVIAFFFVFKKNNPIMKLLVAIVGANILLYSLWGDPWGGWAFGSRYLIPTYAIMSIFIALVLTHLRNNVFFLFFFFVVFSYSVSVNTLGALTTNRNPPQVEVLELEKISGLEQKYTYERNWDYLQTHGSKSFVWQTYLSQYLTAQQYYFLILALILALSYGQITHMIVYGEQEKL